MKQGLSLRGGHDSVSPEQLPCVERRRLESVEGALDRITAVTLTGGRRERFWPDGTCCLAFGRRQHHPEQDKETGYGPIGRQRASESGAEDNATFAYGEEAATRRCRAVPEMPTDKARSVKSRVV